MLKNKKAVYILIPLNVAIWTFFIYRFYFAYHEGDESVSEIKSTEIKLQDIADSSSYHLSLDYKDPFLKSQRFISVDNVTKPIQTKHDPAKVQRTQQIIPKKTPPELKYFGLVKNSSSGNSTALIALNGNSKLVKANDIIDGITIKSFNQDSLIAKWGKERIVLRK